MTRKSELIYDIESMEEITCSWPHQAINGDPSKLVRLTTSERPNGMRCARYNEE